MLQDWLWIQYNILGSGCRESFLGRSGRSWAIVNYLYNCRASEFVELYLQHAFFLSVWWLIKSEDKFTINITS
jgi:hypothetical protein